jgi:hypothetical protein
MPRRIAFFGLVVLLSACPHPTSFEGAAKFPDGATGCRAACASMGLEMGGFVLSGEFATSCVCIPPRATTPSATGTDSSAAVGVVAQMQAAAAAAATQQAALIRQQQLQQQQLQQMQRH